jgi:radical SAM superfamily enzyme YgiQ (UPF0313 family)
MIKKFLLITERPVKKHLYANSLPPLGPLSIIAYLNAKGIRADFIDRNIQSGSEINFLAYDVFGFSVNVANVENSLKTIEIVKTRNPKAKVIVGGPFCSCYPQELIRLAGIDAVIIGEGEESCFEYLTTLDTKNVRGIYFKENKNIIFTGKREFISNLDSLPHPALEKVNLKKYRVPLTRRSPVSNILTSRGCPYNCIFCFNHLGKTWRARSAKSVLDEIQWQVESLGAREICITDDNFTLDIERCREIFEGVLSRGIKVQFNFLNGIRCENITFEMLSLFHKAGVWMISIAPESGDEVTISRISKKTDLEKFKEVVSWCRKLRVVTFAFYMIGFPWEDKASIKRTEDYAIRLGTDFVQVARVELYPQTELYNLYADHGNRIGIFKDKALFLNKDNLDSGGLGNRDICSLRKSIYRKFYLNPKRILNLLQACNPRTLLQLFGYSLVTGSI